MIISHTRKFILIKSLKTAGTSIEAALSNFCSGDDVVVPINDFGHNRDEKGEFVHRGMNADAFYREIGQHVDAPTIKSRVPADVWNSYFKFSIARNRWDRMVSDFTWLARNNPSLRPKPLYVGVMGNRRLQTFPVWELLFQKKPDDQPLIATARARWTLKYQKKWGIISREADNIPEALARHIKVLCKRIYRILGLSGYARFDFRLTPGGELYFLEANPNPQLACGEDFAESAGKGGTCYNKLIQHIIGLGLTAKSQVA